MDALHSAVVGDGDVDPWIAVLISLTRSSGILPRVLDEKLLKSRKARLDALASMDQVGGATKEAIEKEAIEAAAAAMAAVVATSAVEPQ